VDGAINPFTEQSAGQYFVGREGELATFQIYLRGLCAGNPRHMYVAGVHGTGKTSYLNKLSEIAESGNCLGVSVDLDPGSTPRAAVRQVLRRVVVETQEARKGKVAGPDLKLDWDEADAATHFRCPRTSSLSVDAVYEDLCCIERFARETGVRGVVICIDEGQRITGQALSALKNALQRSSFYMAVLSLRLVDDKPSAAEAGRVLLDKKAEEAEGDYGASRLFVGQAMGPFSSGDEAADCVRRRLDGNVIQFTDEVVGRIGEMSQRIPREIIAISSATYDKANELQQSVADVNVLSKAFTDLHRRLVAEMRCLWTEAPEEIRRALRALVRLGHSADSQEITHEAYPEVKGELLPHIAGNIKIELGSLSRRSGRLIQEDNLFSFDNPTTRFALRIVAEGNEL